MVVLFLQNSAPHCFCRHLRVLQQLYYVLIIITIICCGRLYNDAFALCASQVSWMRKRDLHILTAGVLTYTSDQRFQVIHPENSDNWTLLIKFAQPRDAGIYECQVNTEPKMSLAFQLNVVGESRPKCCSVTLYCHVAGLSTFATRKRR